MSKKKISVLVVSAAAAAIILVCASFVFGFSLGRRAPQAVVVQGINGVDGSATTAANFGTFWQAWQMINDNYLRAPSSTDESRVQGAISGLVQSLGDPYSAYFSPQQAETFREDVSGTFSGIGAELGTRQGRLVVVAPLKDTPAEKAGLQPDDQILMINATSTDGLPIDQAVAFIRGEQNTTVKLTIYRDGWDKPKEISIVRQPITAPTLDYKMLPGGIAYVQLYGFNSNADRLFWNAMTSASNSGARGLILDLRGNPGGYLEVAVNLSGWFLPRGTVVVKEAGRQGITDVLRADGNEALVNIPVVVILNKGSASASEILAGALRDDRGVKIVGETSFGKGTVQQVMDLNDGSIVKLTIAHWVLPSGHILENGGLKPDYEVKISDDDVSKKRDPQLDKAVEILKSEMK